VNIKYLVQGVSNYEQKDNFDKGALNCEQNDFKDQGV
jgi:hypothetical protein